MTESPQGLKGQRLFGWLVRAYPARFRDRFGTGMAYAFSRDRERALRAGRLGLLRFWAWTAVSTVGNGTLERLAGIIGRPGRHDPGAGPTRRARGRRGEGLGETSRELRQAARRLVRRPGFTLTAVVTLALGIGATTAIFSVVDAVVLRPLPYEDPNTLVAVGHESPTDRLGMPDGGYLHYAERSRTLSEIGLYLESSSPIAGTGEPLELGIIQTTPSLFSVLGVEPTIGRLFTEEDREPGAASVSIVTHGYWTRHLGQDPDILGKPVLEGSSTTVVGVLPEGFGFLRPEALVVFGNRFDTPDVFLPLGRLDPATARFGNFMYHGLARVAPGATPEEATAELQILMREAAQTYPGGFTVAELEEGRYRPIVSTVKDMMVGDVARILWILLGAVGLVLIIATANVANLFLVRAEARRGEIAVRRALGASRRSLARSFLSESLLLAGVGGALGILLARLGTRALLRMTPSDIPRLEHVGMDGRVLAFALGASVLVGLAFGVVPLIQRTRELGSALHLEGGQRTATRARKRLQNALVVGQVALALVLLVGSGLLLRTFQNLRNVDPGFDPSHTLTLRLSLSGSILSAAGFQDQYADVARTRFMLELSERLQAQPEVEHASFAADLPLDGDEWHDFVATEDAFPESMSSAVKAARVFVAPGYFEAIGAEIVQGREHERADFTEQPRTIVVNEAFAQQRWPGGDPVGRRVAQYGPGLDPDRDIWYTVIGVVRNIRETSLMSPAEPTVYLPTIFLPEGDFAMWVSNMIVVVRTTGEPMAALPRVRSEIVAFQAEVPINNVETLEQLTARSFQNLSFAMLLLLIAAAVSVTLGVVGVYGTVSYVVGRRSREFGLRIALGASSWEVRRGVLGQGAVVGLVGILFGTIGALTLGRVLESLLFGVSTTEPVILVAVAATLLGIVVLASLIPAGRAASVDPAVAMRVD